MSVHANKPLHLPFCESTMEEKRTAWEATLGTNKIRMWDHFGSTDIDNYHSQGTILS